MTFEAVTPAFSGTTIGAALAGRAVAVSAREAISDSATLPIGVFLQSYVVATTHSGEDGPRDGPTV